jgi:hypothetical protein
MSNTPDFIAYTLRDRGSEQKPIRTRIGSAWNHEKGGGMTLQLEALPLNFDGRIVLWPPKAKDDNATEETA